MGFWIAAAVMTLATALAVLLPLARKPVAGQPVDDSPEHDAAIYRDQLAELENDARRGLVGEAEAEAARIEISRRLLKATEKTGVGGVSGALWARRAAAVAAAIFVPALSFGLYLYLGSPEMPDMPRQARLDQPVEKQDIDTLIAKVEAHLAANPDEGDGWIVLARVYMRVGRFAEAAEAYANGTRLLGPTADREADLGEALVMAGGGVVTADARAAFERAVALDAKAVKPRFFLALSLGQDGKHAESAEAWRALIADADSDAGWVGAAREQLAIAEAARDGKPAPQTAADETPSIDEMMSRLAARLEANPDDVVGWSRLIRSYRVLGKADEAAAAEAKARAVFAGRPDEIARLEAALAGEVATEGGAGPAMPSAPAAPMAPVAPQAGAGGPAPSAADIAAAGNMS
ncbi:MAG: c-type cytochrome biogenesis protein CcmI, partial [Hyphomicrobiales bacterium]